MRTLTTPQLNRALLARQLLLERAPRTPAQALARIDGIQAQYAPSMYVGLWSRTVGFERADLDAALESRRVIQATLQRATIHLVAPADYWPTALAVRSARRAQWLSNFAKVTPERVMEAGADRLRRELEGGNTIRRAEVQAMLGPDVTRAIGLWLDLVRAPPSGTWARRRADCFALAEEWVGPPRPDLDEDAAIDHVVRRYLAGFGPSTRDDVLSFTGIARPRIDAALQRLDLRRFDGGLVDLRGAPLPDPQTSAPVRFLGTWDASLLVHARRTGVVPEAYRPRLFTSKNPQSLPTFLVDGAVAGSWRWRDGRIDIDVWTKLDRAGRREVDAEARRLAEMHT